MLCINVAWHLQVITLANNVDKCSFILERTIIQMFIHTRENPNMNLGGSVVECLTRDRRAVGSSLTGVIVLCP